MDKQLDISNDGTNIVKSIENFKSNLFESTFTLETNAIIAGDLQQTFYFPVSDALMYLGKGCKKEIENFPYIDS